MVTRAYSPTLILGYYSVVAGWTLEFIAEAATNSFAGKSAADFIASFNSFVSNPWRPVIWLVLFLLATHLIIVKGGKGIEKSAKIMMPMLFVLLIILAICSISLPGAGAGIEFLLKPDFSKVDGNVFLGAMGQAFFSLSLGMGCLCTYASYFRNDTNLPKTALNVAAIDTMVAIFGRIHHFPCRLLWVSNRMRVPACYSSPYRMSFSKRSAIFPGWRYCCL